MKIIVDKKSTAVKNYIPQPTKLEGYTSFPRPLSRPYVNKAEYFKSNVLKEPKPLIKKEFMNTHNNFVFNKDHNFKSNNVGVSYMTASLMSMSQSQETREKVLNDFGKSKIIKALISKGVKSGSTKTNIDIGKLFLKNLV